MSAKRKSHAVRSSGKTKRRTGKSKVTISTKKALLLCLVITAVCIAFVYINDRPAVVKDVQKTVSVSPVQKENEAAEQPQKPAETEEHTTEQNTPEIVPPAVSEKPAEKKTEKSFLPEKKAATEKKSIIETKKTAPETEKKSAVQKTSSVIQKHVSVPTAVPAKPSSAFPELPSAVNHAQLVFVFDDAGQNSAQLEKYVTLPFPVTVAVLPGLIHSKTCADRIRKSGNEVMLHQPMQAINLNVNPGPKAITPSMDSAQISQLVRQNIAEVGPVAGMNNHEGSLISEDEMKIGTVMQIAKELGVFFLDSRTTSQTRVPQASMALGIPYYERNVFLDNNKDKTEIIKEVKRGLDIANTKGVVIMIGHVWAADVLPGVLIELYPALKSKGYTFSTVSKSKAKINP